MAVGGEQFGIDRLEPSRDRGRAGSPFAQILILSSCAAFSIAVAASGQPSDDGWTRATPSAIGPPEAMPASPDSIIGVRPGTSLSSASAGPAVVETTFDGFDFDENGIESSFSFIPPDPIGAAGPASLIAVGNVLIEARDKTGARLWGDDLWDFFTPLAPIPVTSGGRVFDPKIVYDHHEDRFVVVALERFSVNRNPDPGNVSRILLAVSRSDNPTTKTPADWYFHAIDSKLLFQNPTFGLLAEHWADYPGFEVDEEAIYITANMFSFACFSSGPGGPTCGGIPAGGFFGGMRLWIVDKGVADGFYAGGPAGVTVHDPFAAVGRSGLAQTTMPAEIFGASGVGPGIGTFLIAYGGLRFPPGDPLFPQEAVQIIRVDDPLGTGGGPLFSSEFVPIGDIEDPVGPIAFPSLPQAPQAGCNSRIEVNDRRTLDAVWRNGSLWATTTIRANSPVDFEQTTARWFRFDTTAAPLGPIVLADSGNLSGEDITPDNEPVFTFFASVAVNAAGDAMFGFGASSPTIFPGAFAAGRRPGDAPGTVRATATIRAGQAPYDRRFGGLRNRWGDYSGIALDPLDDGAFWVFNEYARLTQPNECFEDGKWGTAWARVAFGCGDGVCDLGETSIGCPTDCPDQDGDDVADVQDNCVLHFNPIQADTDGDGFGDRCDGDKNCDLMVDGADVGEFVDRFGEAAAMCDYDGNGVVGMSDLIILMGFIGQAPGPSCCGICLP